MTVIFTTIPLLSINGLEVLASKRVTMVPKWIHTMRELKSISSICTVIIVMILNML